jgi:hypothetical protein
MGEKLQKLYGLTARISMHGNEYKKFWEELIAE